MNTNDILLKNRDYSDITENVIQLIFKRRKKRFNFQLNPHLLRHTFATKFIINGGDISTLQLILGHSKLDMCLNYLHLANSLQISKYAIYSPLNNKTIQ